jgi:signal transduction histidine kinase
MSYITKLFVGLVLASALVWTAVSRDRDIRTDLKYDLASASARLSSLFSGYRVAKEYNGKETLYLVREEFNLAVASWPRLRETIYLQAIETQGRFYLDSRTNAIRPYATIDPLCISTGYGGSWHEGRPFLYVDDDLSGDGREILRAAITFRDYLVAQLLGMVWVLVALSAIAVSGHFFREASRRRQFGQLVGDLTSIVRHNETVESLLHQLPRVIGEMLGLDAVAIYLREGDFIVPKAWYFKAGADCNTFLRSTDAEPISIDGAYPESRAMRENRSIVVSGAECLQAVHRANFEAPGSRPYVIAPLSREGGPPIGLLSAQFPGMLRRARLRRQDLDFLRRSAEISTLLLENVRSAEALARMYRQMIRTARTVTLGMVVPNIAHSMRTPLVVISALATSIAEHGDTLDRLELKGRLAEIIAQTDVCFEEIRSISRYRRLGASSTGSVNIRQGLERVCGFFHGYFRIKGIDLVLQSCPDTNLVVQMQELDFVQVVNNLLTNCDEAFSELLDVEGHPADHRKFTVEVSARPDSANGGVLISVVDNGPGIAAKALPRIFEQDFTTKKDGSGVGLSYCHFIVREAGGWIKVESALGEGTAFTIFLPAAGDRTARSMDRYENSTGG